MNVIKNGLLMPVLHTPGAQSRANREAAVRRCGATSSAAVAVLMQWSRLGKHNGGVHSTFYITLHILYCILHRIPRESEEFSMRPLESPEDGSITLIGRKASGNK